MTIHARKHNNAKSGKYMATGRAKEKFKQGARTFGKVVLGILGVSAPLLMDAQVKDLKAPPPKQETSIAYAALGRMNPGSALGKDVPDTASTGNMAMANESNAPITGLRAVEPIRPVKTSGEKFADVTVEGTEVAIDNYAPKDSKHQYSFGMEIQSNLNELKVGKQDLREIVFQVNENQSKQVSLVFNKGIITIYIDDNMVLGVKKKRDKINCVVTTIGCPVGDGLMQWKLGTDGSIVTISNNQVSGFMNTTPMEPFTCAYNGGAIKQMIAKDNVRIITIGSYITLIAPEFNYNSSGFYDGETITGPVVIPDGKIIMSTPKTLLIAVPGNKWIDVDWNKTIPGIGDLRDIDLRHVGDFVEIHSANFKLSDGTEYKVLINLKTMKLTSAKIDPASVMLN